MQFFVASFAHGDELPGISIIDRKCQVWPIFQVIHMVDDGRPPVPVTLLTSLALVVVHFEHLGPELAPFWPGVKVMRFSGLYQRIKLDVSGA